MTKTFSERMQNYRRQVYNQDCEMNLNVEYGDANQYVIYNKQIEIKTEGRDYVTHSEDMDGRKNTYLTVFSN